MREIRTSGSVGEAGGNPRLYPALVWRMATALNKLYLLLYLSPVSHFLVG